MDDDIARLLRAMEALAAFLGERGQRHWATWVEADARRIREGDASGLTHFLSAFGGMGSLSDLTFSPRNGNATTDQEAVELNSRLGRLVETASREAESLRRSAGAD